MINYSHWDLLEEIRFEEAVCLWCEIEPYNSPRARRDQHPESVPVERFLLAAYKSGELPVRTETLKWIFSVKQTGLPDDNGAFVQKADLRKLAEQKGVRPRFLFPEDERLQQKSSIRADSPSKGGLQPKLNKSLQVAIDRIAGFVGQPITLARVVEWLRDNADSENQYTFDPPIPGCDDLYIDGKRLVFKDREGREDDRALKSLERYVQRARKTLT